MGAGTPQQVRQAVRETFEVFGTRGLVLSALPFIRVCWLWENVPAMFGQWRSMRRERLPALSRFVAAFGSSCGLVRYI